jgi:hypothetical protein
MSGSGGNFSRGVSAASERSSGASGQSTDCTRFMAPVLLDSPKPAVIAMLRVGDILELEFGGQRQVVIEARTRNGQVAGAVTGLPKLRRCMQEGYRYIAEVMSVKGGACNVQIRYRS